MWNIVLLKQEIPQYLFRLSCSPGTKFCWGAELLYLKYQISPRLKSVIIKHTEFTWRWREVAHYIFLSSLNRGDGAIANVRTLPPNVWPISRTSGISERKWIFSFPQTHSEVYTSSYKIMSKNPIHIKEPFPHTRRVFYSIQFSPYSDHIINHKGPMANKTASSLGQQNNNESSIEITAWIIIAGNYICCGIKKVLKKWHQKLLDQWLEQKDKWVYQWRPSWLTARAHALTKGAWSLLIVMAGSFLVASVKGSPVEQMVGDKDISSQSFVTTLMLWGLGFNAALYVEDLDW